MPAGKLVRVIAFMNQKGGVGKTTTTVNLAAAFARAGRPTLLVDLDPQAHATLHVGFDPGERPTVYDALLDPARGGEAVAQVRPNLSILPSTTDLAAAEVELSQASDRHRRLVRVLDSLAGRFEFVLIDCPPSLGLLTLNGLAAAREVVIPMQAHFLALQGVGKLLETVRLLAANANNRLFVSGVVLCMHDPASTHVREVVSDLEQFFEGARGQDVPWKFARVLRPAVRRNIKLAECPSFGQTVFDYAPTAPGAEDYQALAAGMLRDWDDMLARRAASADQTGGPATVAEVRVPNRQPAPAEPGA